MTGVEVRGELDAEERDAVQALLDRATAVDGVTPLDEGRWLELHAPANAPASNGPRPIALIARREGHLVAYGHLRAEQPAPAPGEGAPGEGQLQWSLAVAVDPQDRVGSQAITDELADATSKVVAAGGGGSLTLWASQPRPDHERLAARLGLRPDRALYQMRRPLPVGEAFELTTRPFRPGVDEQDWLTVNNRAFAWHPEQGGWTLAELEAHEALPWFDPEGFLVYEAEGRLAGFCWTKVHAQHQPPLGEIYVIATDPDFAGAGLGRRLTLAGLDHLARSGVSTGMLYVDADNVRAVKLYVDLGFVVHHVDVNFARPDR